MKDITTRDGAKITVHHQPEAENDFVVMRLGYTHPDVTGATAHMQPHEAIELASSLLNHALIAQAAHARYLAGKK